MSVINKETPIVKRIQIEASKVGARLFRNNNGALQNNRGEWITYGLGKGTADLVGWLPVNITPEMVGSVMAVFVACEVKTETGKLTEEQKNFIDVINRAGGIAFMARSDQEAVANLRGTQWGTTLISKV